MQFQKVNDEKIEFLKDVLEFNVPGENYILIEKDDIIGYSRIYNRTNDSVFIYIPEEYRGNGYGEKIFDLSLKQIIHPEITLTISKNNMRMHRIIKKYTTIELVNMPKYITYVIKVEKAE